MGQSGRVNPHLILRIAGALLAVLIAPAVFVYLVTTEHQITYDEDGEYTIACDPIAAADGDGWLFDHSGGPIDASVVEGEDVLDSLKDDARERGFDVWYVQRALDKDCVDLRQAKMMWATAWAALGLVGLIVAARPMPGPRRDERLPSEA